MGIYTQFIYMSIYTQITAAFQYLKGDYKKAGEGLLTRACSDRTRRNAFKLKEGTFRLDIKEEILYSEGGEALAQVVRLSGEAVDAPALAVLAPRPGWMGL